MSLHRYICASMWYGVCVYKKYIYMSLHKYTCASLWYGVCVCKSYEYMSLHKYVCASMYTINVNTFLYTNIHVRLCGMV